MPKAEDLADADRQFWTLARALRAGGPDLASLCEDAEYLAREAITPALRARAADLAIEGRLRLGARPLGGHEVVGGGA